MSQNFLPRSGNNNLNNGNDSHPKPNFINMTNTKSGPRAHETSLIVGKSSQGHSFLTSNREAFSSINSSRNTAQFNRARSNQNFASMNKNTIENTLVIGKRSHNASTLRLSSTNNFNGPQTDSKLSSSPLKDLNESTNIDYTFFEPVQLQVRFHETRTSTADVFLDLSLVPGAKEGDIGELESLESSSKKLCFVFKKDPTKTATTNNSPIALGATNSTNNNYISVQSGVIPTLMDLKLRSQVLVRLKNKADVEADVVEVYIKDLHLSRGDMWNLTAILVGNCLYKSQKVSFLQGSIRGTVNRLYKNGKKLFSAYVGENTKVVFRSESARLVFFIQISAEMWHFEESGQLMFHKLMNSLFPKILQRWKELGTNHLITIVLFSSVNLEPDGSLNYEPGKKPESRKDYYRVVVDQVNIVLWNEIMAALRLEFTNYERDIKIQLNERRTHSNPQEYIIRGRFLPSVKGNLLEAINLGSSLVSDDFRDPDLRHTTNHFVVISPGTGIFDVDYDMLLKTSKLMSRIDVTIDVICLSQPPLHVVPLFRYLDHQSKLQYCIPSWMDISFWNDSGVTANQWMPRCKIYELQMMGVMENEISAITVQPLNFENSRSIVDAMDEYDQSLFESIEKPEEHPDRLSHGLAKKKSLSSLINEKVSRPSSLKKMLSNDSLNSTSDLKLNPFPVNNSATEKTATEVSATTSNVMGVTSGKPNVSAFSSLLTISKTTGRNTTSNAFNFMKRIISSPLPSSASTAPSIDDSFKLDDNTTSTSTSGGAEKDGKPAAVPIKPINPWNIKSANTDDASTFSNERDDNKSIIGTSHSNSRHRISAAHNKANTEEKAFYILNTYWTKVENPSNAITSELLGMVTYGRWQFVFPPNVKRRAIKWTSISSPASLPLKTPVFPTVTDFNQNFTFRIYDVFLNNEGVNNDRNSETLMRQMISLRLTLGFQICVGENVNNVENQRKPNGDSRLLISFLNKKNCYGSRIYMSMSNEIHRISCDYNGIVNVQVYKRTMNNDENNYMTPSSEYIPSVRTRYAEEYLPVHISAFTENMRNYNWNQLDQIQAGYDDSNDGESKSHRVKFVILPTKVPPNALKLANSTEVLNPEEVRLDGIRSLISTVHRARFRTLEERQKSRGRTKDELTPEINFYTGSLFTYLKDAWKKLSTGERNTSNLFEEASFDQLTPLNKLASAIQSDKGVAMVDRVWHLRTHKNCFLGMELVNWMLENFSDIDTREQAVEFGNSLMKEGMFYHVESRHTFLDGHYFYQFRPEYLLENIQKKSSESSNDDSYELTPVKTNTSSNRVASSNATPSLTPITHSVDDKDVDSLRKAVSLKNLNDLIDSPGLSAISEKRERVVLSRKILCDLDPHGHSWQPEILTVHYDIVHNPEHCFHLRLEWLNATSKLIEDTVNSWAKLCERYGLTLVETPWQELCTLPLRNPLHSSVDIVLALNPWTDSEFSTPKELLEESHYFYHMYLLEKSGFLLDNRTAVFFKDDTFDVTYSWGKPTFKFAQYIHKTGAYIAELRNNGAFFLAPNNAHIARVNLNVGSQQKNSTAATTNASAIYLDSQSVMLDFRSICQDEKKLRELFREAKSNWEVSKDIEAAIYDATIQQ